MFLVDVKLGSQRQPFQLMVDSGSEYLWVPSKSCEGEGCEGRQLFDSGNSTSFQLAPKKADDDDSNNEQCSFADGKSIAGHKALDRVELSPELVLDKQLFLEVNEIPKREDSFSDNFDGLLGMGLAHEVRYIFGNSEEDDYEQKGHTVLFGLHKQGLIDKRMFSVYLNNDNQIGFDNFDKHQSGELLFGSQVDSSKFVGDELLWVPLERAVSGHKMWIIQLDSVRLEPAASGPSKSSIKFDPDNEGQLNGPFRALVDTGTYGLAAPRWAAEQINEILGGMHIMNGMFIVSNCEKKLASMPTLVLTIGGQEFSLTPEQYMIPISRGHAKQHDCWSGIRITPSSAHEDRWLLGDLFIANNYVAFDADDKRIGLAPLKAKFRGPNSFIRPDMLERGWNIGVSEDDDDDDE